jgi:hypothetical protein
MAWLFGGYITAVITTKLQISTLVYNSSILPHIFASPLTCAPIYATPLSFISLFTLNSVRKIAGPLIAPSISCSSRRVMIVRGRDRILFNTFSHFSRSAQPFKVGFFDTPAGHTIIKWQSVSAAAQHCGGARHQQRFIVRWILAFYSDFSLSWNFPYFLSHIFVPLFILFNPLSFLSYFSVFSASKPHTTSHMSA